MYITTLPSPDGPFHVAVTELGVAAAAMGDGRDAFELVLRRRFGQLPLSADDGARDAFDLLAPALAAVLSGERHDVRTVPLDLRDRPRFDQLVLEAVREVPWGWTASYGEIAARIGIPRAARAVGGAVGRDPVSILVPCHRIIAADGSLGGYGGLGPFERADGLERKRALLLREGVTVAPTSH